ncbi:hypothetical protein LTR49_006209 [Elasticomyces elasticus]|nr:hypothetical protein LTR49_006209 [Elasticomyces elasticus]
MSFFGSPSRILNKPVLNNVKILETGKKSLLIRILDCDSLRTANDVALVVPELTLSIGLQAKLGDLLRVTLGELTNDCAVGVDQLASLVAGESFEDRERWELVAFLLLGLTFTLLTLTFLCLFALGLTLAFTFGLLLFGAWWCSGANVSDDIALLVENLTLLVHLLALAVGKLTINKLANDLTILVEDLAVLVDLEPVKNLQARKVWSSNLLWCVLLGLTQLFQKLLGSRLGSLTRDDIDMADDIALLVKHLALVVALLASALRQLAVAKLTELLTILVEDLTLLVDLLAVQNAKVEELAASQLLSCTFRKLGLSEDVTLLINNVALLVDLEGCRVDLTILDLLLEVLIGDVTKNVAFCVSDLTSLVNLVTLKSLDTRKLVLNLGLLLSAVGSIFTTFRSLVGSVFDSRCGTIDGALSLLSLDRLAILSLLRLRCSIVDALLDKVCGIFVNLGMANNIAILVDELSPVVEGGVLKLLWVSIDDFADSVAVVVVDQTVDLALEAVQDSQLWECRAVILLFLLLALLLVAVKLVEVLISTLWQVNTIVLGGLQLLLDLVRVKLATTDKISIIIKDLAFVTDWVTSKIFGITFGELADCVAFGVVDVSVLVDLKTLQHRQVNGQTLWHLWSVEAILVGGLVGGVFAILLDALDILASLLGCALGILASILASIFGFTLSILDLTFNALLGALGSLVSIGILNCAFCLLACIVDSVLSSLASFLGGTLCVCGLRCVNVVCGIFGGLLSAIDGLAGLVFSTLGGVASLVGSCARDLLAFLGGLFCRIFGVFNFVFNVLLGVVCVGSISGIGGALGPACKIACFVS